MNKYSNLCIGMILLCTSMALAQKPVFLLITPSPRAGAMGNTIGAALETSPLSVIMNPAALGMYASKNKFGIETYPMQADWLGDNGSGLGYDAFSMAIGKTFQYGPQRLTIGLAAHRVKMGIYEKVRYNAEVPQPLCICCSYGRSIGVSLAAALDTGPVILGFGVNLKSITHDSFEKEINTDSKPAFDYGLLLRARLLPETKPGHQAKIAGALQPFINPGFIFGVSNIGDAFTKDPDYLFPCTVNTGVHIIAGIRYFGHEKPYDLVSLRWAREATDRLDAHLINGSIMSNHGFWDINFFKHILQGKAAEHNITKSGTELSIADMFYISRGHYEDLESSARFRSTGWGCNVTRSTVMLSDLLNIHHQWLVALAHVQLWFTQAHYHTDKTFHYWSRRSYLPNPGTRITSISAQFTY